MAKVALVQEAPPEVDDGAPAPKKKGKLFIILGLVLVLLGGGGGAAWYFMGHGKGGHEEEKPAKEVPPVFLPVDQFTVNLNPEGGEQFLQAAFTFKVTDQEVVESIKLRLPDVRNRILLLLSAKKAAELTTVDGKQRLTDEIMVAANEAINATYGSKKKDKSDDEEDGKKGKTKAKKKAAEKSDEEDAKPDSAAKSEKTADKAVDKADKAEKPADKPAEDAKAEAPAKPARVMPPVPTKGVTAVLITHFIIQ
jgi:flagellar FliL protein